MEVLEHGRSHQGFVWHAQSLVTLHRKQLPLFMVLHRTTLLCLVSLTLCRLKLKQVVEPLAVGLLYVLALIPVQALSASFLWSTWHHSYSLYQPRWVGVPWAAYIEIFVQAVFFFMFLSFSRVHIVGTHRDVSGSLFKEVLCIAVSSYGGVYVSRTFLTSVVLYLHITYGLSPQVMCASLVVGALTCLWLVERRRISSHYVAYFAPSPTVTPPSPLRQMRMTDRPPSASSSTSAPGCEMELRLPSGPTRRANSLQNTPRDIPMAVVHADRRSLSLSTPPSAQVSPTNTARSSRSGFRVGSHSRNSSVGSTPVNGGILQVKLTFEEKEMLLVAPEEKKAPPLSLNYDPDTMDAVSIASDEDDESVPLLSHTFSPDASSSTTIPMAVPGGGGRRGSTGRSGGPSTSAPLLSGLLRPPPLYPSPSGSTGSRLSSLIEDDISPRKHYNMFNPGSGWRLGAQNWYHDHIFLFFIFHFLVVIALALSCRPEAVLSTSLRQQAGGGVQCTQPIEVVRHRLTERFCPSRVSASDPFDFSCVFQEVPVEDQSWYTICGRPHPFPSEFFFVVLTYSLYAFVVVFYILRSNIKFAGVLSLSRTPPAPISPTPPTKKRGHHRRGSSSPRVFRW